jgi:hypothetical protein
MDTRFWGPSGWRLLHLVAASDLGTRRVKEWFELLEYVLPCKYCRASFHDYIRKLPLTDDIVADPAKFSRWIYDIHNMVNDKLRKQGLLKTPNPPFTVTPTAKEFVGWDFFTAIAFTTPGPGMHSTPLPGGRNARTLAARNRYNRLTCAERLRLLRRWWTLTPSILPVAEWRRAWQASVTAKLSTDATSSVTAKLSTDATSSVTAKLSTDATSSVTAKLSTDATSAPPVSGGRQAMMKWLWALEEGVCSRLQCETHHDSLPQLVTVCAAFESKCGTAKRGKTCRTRKWRRYLTRRN